VEEDAIREYWRSINDPDEDLDDIDWSIFHQDCCGE